MLKMAAEMDSETRAFQLCSSVVFLLSMITYCFSHSEGCTNEERAAALQIKESIGYRDGADFSDWVGEDCCLWTGINCDDSSPPVVIQIVLSNIRDEQKGWWYPNASLFAQFKGLTDLELPGNQIREWILPQELQKLKNLSALTLSNNQLTDESIATWINNLPSLTSLYLSDNDIVGSSFLSGFESAQKLNILHLGSNKLSDQFMTPWISNLTSLTEIDLSNNTLTDATWLYNLTSLTYIALSQNQLSGSSIMAGICNLKQLYYLDLSDNKITGSIYPCLGGLQLLENLDLSSNQLNGSIPDFALKNLSVLEYLFLGKNQFSGVVSFSSFANLSQLYTVALSSQIEVETELPSWVPSFQLHELYLANCIINKNNGGKIPTFLSTQSKLQRLDLANSSLAGPIPPWLIYNNSLVALRLKENMLQGPFPQPHQNKTAHARFIDISRNNISGILPIDIGFLFPNLHHANMSANALKGSIPPSLGKIRHLEVLDLSYNNLSGSIPIMLTRNTSLVFLILSNNILQGEMLPTLSSMSRLVVLDLHGNRFTGNISQQVLNSPLLKILDIRRNDIIGTIPQWLHNMTNIVAVLLASNHLEGHIPFQLCQLMNLHILDLSGNLLEGIIPHCLNSISSMKKASPIQIIIPDESASSFEKSGVQFEFTTKGISYVYKGIPFSLMTGIDLSMNFLSGSIPNETGDLIELRSLNLSNNFLSGPLPESFQNLENLESLDLSHNELVGEIPPKFVQMKSLSTFSVAYNNLSGCVPLLYQFSSFGASSYAGNPQLHENCSSDSHPQPHKDDDEEEEDSSVIDSIWFPYLLSAISFAIGFWGVIAPIILKKKWRYKYFEVIDSYIDPCVWKFKVLYAN